MPDVRVHIGATQDVSKATKEAADGMHTFRDAVKGTTQPIRDFTRSVRDIMTGAGVAILISQMSRVASDAIAFMRQNDAAFEASFKRATDVIKNLKMQALQPLADSIRVVSDAIGAMGANTEYVATQMKKIADLQKTFLAGKDWRDIATEALLEEKAKIEATLYLNQDKGRNAGIRIPAGINLLTGPSTEGQLVAMDVITNRQVKLEAEIQALLHYITPSPAGSSPFNLANMLSPAYTVGGRWRASEEEMLLGANPPAPLAIGQANINEAITKMVTRLRIEAISAIKTAIPLQFRGIGMDREQPITGSLYAPPTAPVQPVSWEDTLGLFGAPRQAEKVPIEETATAWEKLNTALDITGVLMSLLNRALGPALAILGPAIDKMIQPLSVMFTVIATKLVPVLEWLQPVFDALGEVVKWTYDKVLLPLANALIFLLNCLYNLGMVIRNIVTLDWAHLKKGTIDPTTGQLTSITDMDIGAATEAAAGYGASYSSQTTVQPVTPVYIYFTIQGNVIGAASKEELGTWLVDCIQRALGTGVRPEFLEGAA